MRKKLLLIFLLSVLGPCAKAQNEMNDNPGFAESQLAFQFVNHNADSAIVYADRAITLARANNDRLVAGKALSVMGEAYRVKGDLEKSTFLHLKAIEVLPDSKEGNSIAASAWSGLGNNAYSARDIEKAKNYYRKCFNIKRDLNKKKEAAISATQLIGVYGVLGQTDSAFALFNKVRPTLENDPEMGDYLAALYNNMGATYQVAGNLDSSLYYYRAALEINKKENLGIQFSSCLFNIAFILQEQGKTDEAIKNLNQALEYLEIYPSQEIEKETYLALSDMYSRLNDYKSSLKYRIRKDSVQSIIDEAHHQAKILELESRFATAKKDKQLKEQQIQLQQNKIDIAEQEQLTYQIIIAGIIVLMIILFIALRLWFRRKSEHAFEAEKEKLFSNIIHEIRTPLSLITGPLEQIKNNPSGIDQNFKIIERNSKRLSDLVGQLLDVSKVDANRYELQNQYGNLQSFIEEMIENHKPLLQQKELKLETELKNCDRNITTDFESLYKIIVNLLTNAIKYSYEGSTIQLHVIIEGSDLMLIVKDKGIGISKKDLPKIFDRFSRSRNSTYVQGVGIGLSLVKRLVELMGGDIDVESEEGKGTIFQLRLPVSTDVVPEEHNEQHIDEDKQIILVVDDDDDMRKFIGSILEREDLQILTAKNGKDALRKLTHTLPDIIISDVMMPDMDGLDFSKQLKSNSLLEHIPLILLSAKTSSKSKMEGLSSGADLYLEKPFQPQELLITVKNQLTTLANNRKHFSDKLQSTDLSFDEKLQTTDAYLQRVNKIILEELDNTDFSVEDLADRLAISRSQLHRKIKSLTDCNVSSYIRIIRLERAYELLKTNSGNVTEIAYLTGFGSQSYFTKTFTEHFGHPPSDLLTKVG